MRPITITLGPFVAASANAIALAQAVAAPNSVNLNGASASGGVATLDMSRRVLITSAGNDSAKTFRIVGTDRYGNTQAETLTGANAGAVQSALDYATVTSITPSASTPGNITVGTSGVGSSAWVRSDEWASPAMAAQVEVTGTINYTLEQTMDDPNSPTDPIAPALVTWFPVEASGTSNFLQFSNSPCFLRLTSSSGLGSVRAIFTQYGASNLKVDTVSV